MPFDSRHIPHPSSRGRAQSRVAYREITGVIHIHSDYSDGSRSIEEIAETGRQQELDYLIFTDHDSLQGRRDGKAGWYGETLVLVDEEISAEGGHYLALNVPREIRRKQSEEETVRQVKEAGGLGFIAHPFWKRKLWKNLQVHGMTGVEIYSAVQDVAEENVLWLGLWTLLTGSEFSITKWLKPDRRSLDYWDQLTAQGERVVGIGSPDAHGLQRFGLRLAPYSSMFRLVRTHLLVRELSPEGIYDALAQGRAFVAHDLVADAKGFQFTAVRNGAVQAVMGEQVQWAPDLKLYVYLPSPGKIVVWKDGQLYLELEGQNAWFPAPERGVYRIEASRKTKPWIYSNPIYVVK